jgi:hypothetical protein
MCNKKPCSSTGICVCDTLTNSFDCKASAAMTASFDFTTCSGTPVAVASGVLPCLT